MGKKNQNISLRHLLFRRKLAKNEEGATSIEYGLIIALVSVALLSGASCTGNYISLKFIQASAAVGNTTQNTGG